jgi:hypothetical protein
MTQPADYSEFLVGNVLQPLPVQSPNSLLQDADPALFFAIDFWSYVITTYPGPRLLAAAAAAGITSIKQAVAATYPYEPLPQQLENQFSFPLLAVYRKEAQTEWHTVGHETDSTALEVLYVLPPMDAAASERLLPIFNAIMQALRRKSTDAWDPGYTPPGGNLGDQYTAAPYAHVEEMGFGEDRFGLAKLASFGFLPAAEGLYFPTLKLQAYVRERDNYATTPGGPSQFAGGDITGNVKADDGTRVAPFVQVATQLAPTVSTLSVASGPVAGGTVTNITGLLFLAGPPAVYFGPVGNPQYAPSVTWNSATSLTVTTPAMSGAGTVDVTVLNRDGQSGTLPQSFTFT